MPARAFPRTPDAIDVPWVERTLRTVPELAAVRVVACAVEPLSARSATGQLVRLRLGYDDGAVQGPATLIAKLASPLPAVRKAALSGYAKELSFYRELGADPGVPVPRCYGGELDADSGELILLLEELAEPPGRFSRLALAQRTVSELAPFHAKWWASPRLSSFRWLDDAEAERIWAGVFVQAVPALRASLGAALPETFAEVAALFAAHYDATTAWMSEAPRTLVHGDLHLQQVYCVQSGRFALLDWQTVAIGAGVSDVARVLVSSTEPDTQAVHEAAIVEGYHRALVEHGVRGYSLEACREHYVRSILRSVFIHSVGAMQLDLTQFQARSAAQGRPWTDRFFGWVDAALVRHGVLDRLRAALGHR
jgi:hypothetical protein